jgi:ABC-type glycerol-3-phosphate transport system substrate-binding protein
MDDMLADGRINLGEIYPAALEDVKYDGQTYGFPQFMDVRALYVNLDAMGEVGADAATINTGDWDQLAQLGAQLVKRNGDAVERWGFDHKMQAGWLWLWAQANGGKLMSDDGARSPSPTRRWSRRWSGASRPTRTRAATSCTSRSPRPGRGTSSSPVARSR